MCDQSAEQQRDGFNGRQEQQAIMGTLRCRRGLPYEAKSLPSGEEREYHVRVGVPNRKFWLHRPMIAQARSSGLGWKLLGRVKSLIEDIHLAKVRHFASALHAPAIIK